MQTSTDCTHILRGMYAAEREYLATAGTGYADFAVLAPYFAENVVLCQATALPYGGVWRGHDGMRRFFVAMSAAWAEFEMLDQQFLATTETAVVRTRVRARARATRRELSFPILQTLRIADGRITEVYPFYWDTAAIVAAMSD